MNSSDPFEPVASNADGTKPRSRSLLYVLVGIVGLLLIILIVLLVSLLIRMRATTSPEATASGTESAVATSAVTTTDLTTEPGVAEASPNPQPEPEPQSEPSEATSTAAATGPRFTSFDAPTTEHGCSLGGPAVDPTRPLAKVAWTTEGAEQAWFVQGTSDAADSAFMQIPLDGNQSDFPYAQEFACSSDSSTYTITLVGSDGTHVSKSWTVQNTGDVF